MHKAISILMFKLECQVIDRNPDFQMQGRDYLRRIDWSKHTVRIGEKEYPLRDTSFPTVDPAAPAALNPDEQLVLTKLVQSFRQSEKCSSMWSSSMPRAACTTLRTAICSTTVQCP